MTQNKPIIIDGINVDECECSSQIDLDVNIICTSNFSSKKSGYCKDNPNCLFKQLKSKEQECEEKDKGIKFLLEKLDLSNNRIQDCEIHWEKERKKLKQQLDQLKTSKEQAEQKLEEIRQICSCSKGQMNCELCPMCGECEEFCVNDENLQNIILQIIDEVE